MAAAGRSRECKRSVNHPESRDPEQEILFRYARLRTYEQVLVIPLEKNTERGVAIGAQRAFRCDGRCQIDVQRYGAVR